MVTAYREEGCGHLSTERSLVAERVRGFLQGPEHTACDEAVAVAIVMQARCPDRPANAAGEALPRRHAPALDKGVTNEGHFRGSGSDQGAREGADRANAAE
jgi:hypothetical protein